MLQIGEETPSRFELLSVVRKHSNLLGKTTVDEEDATDVEMDGKFWHDVFDLYFVRGKESRGRQDDDLIFFVRKWKGHGFNESEESVAPYFVRSHNVLRNHQVGQDTPLSAIYKVVKTVYASPSRVNFHLDSKKEVETTPAYPDICFAIDDFDFTFDAVVLTETDHCYCVLLNALDGAAFPSEKDTNDSSSSNKVPLRVDTNSMKTKNSKLTLFSGFVSYQMVRDAYDAGSSGFGSLLSMGHSSGKKDRLYMKGPGGRGEVEVAVSGVVDQSKEDSGPFSPIISKKGFGLGSIVRKAASVASVAAKNAYAAASATSSSDEEMIPLKCCLMSITLPWEHIAYDLLFKGSPPVNL
ncbi:uncharacterized protein LOC105773600 isoform X2 [Gossypium raimondii]|uniref:Cw7 protein n=1 Tax=Gossypium raimondii TaxID=29730 RepID=A0A0D2SLI0_GOSRA|nr:uncharacterized protein LOC105773600 isoform X2 [Gossypium raimondii]KJB63958.1 hypothetical protein B456_010G026900 [Gossypium raimondii]